MSENIVAETAQRIFADLADPQTINTAQNFGQISGKDTAWKAPLWDALAQAGLTLAWVPEELGGAGADMADGFEVLLAAGRAAAPVPIAEMDDTPAGTGTKRPPDAAATAAMKTADFSERINNSRVPKPKPSAA